MGMNFQTYTDGVDSDDALIEVGVGIGTFIIVVPWHLYAMFCFYMWYKNGDTLIAQFRVDVARRMAERAK